jgi:type I restriction enzyme M protein
LFFDKGKPTKEVWYYDHPYPEGQKSYTKSRPINVNEFMNEKDWWNNRVENEYAWKVSIKEIKDRDYNLDIKNPNSAETEEIKSSDHYLGQLESSLKDSLSTIIKLKESL